VLFLKISVNRGWTEHQQSFNGSSTERQQSINTGSIECQQSVNDDGCCILYDAGARQRHIPRINVLVAVVSKWDQDMVISSVWKLVSTEHQRFSVLHLAEFKRCAMAITHKRSIGSHYWQYGLCQCCHMSSVNGASTILGLVNEIIGKWFARFYP